MKTNRKLLNLRRGFLNTAGLILVLVLTLSLVSVVWAHQNVTVGEYTVEYGWASEPAVVGQPNAVVVNLSLTAQGTAPAQDANIDVSNLKIEAVFGGQTKVLTLQPLGENTPGQFIAPITPMRPGKYTIHLSGTVGKTSFNTDVAPEEIQTADVVQFPTVDSMPAASSNSAGIMGWVGVGGAVLGAIGVILGALAFVRVNSRE